MGIIYAKYKLNRINANELALFSFKGFKTYAKVVKVHDGDTCHVIFKYKKQYIKYSIRMLGYNSPELNDKDKGGLQHRDELHKLIFGKIVWLECDHFCKYGRILGTIYYKGKNINEH